jgi:hypothetical protein
VPIERQERVTMGAVDVKAGKANELFRGVPTAGSCRGPNATDFPQKKGYAYCIDRKNLSPMRQVRERIFCAI